MAGQRVEGATRRTGPWRVAVWGGAALLLLAPLLAMQVSEQMAWGAGDFAILAAMLAVACGAFELVLRMPGGAPYRTGAALALAAAFLLVWVNLAVGVIGSEDHPANLLYAGVLAVALLGAALARFGAGGMARAMTATALAQAGVGAGALIAGLDATLPLDLIFAALWLGSAWLFRKAAQDGSKAEAP